VMTRGVEHCSAISGLRLASLLGVTGSMGLCQQAGEGLGDRAGLWAELIRGQGGRAVGQEVIGRSARVVTYYERSCTADNALITHCG
jgi:hypothetical protein